MKNEKKEIKYFSMFTGVGGFELGFERANNLSKTERDEQRGNEKDSSNTKQIRLATKQFTCVGFSEIDKYANELLKQKFPTVKNYGDATKINPRELSNFDMLCGGFPCQAFSIAGKRRGFQDTRGTLFFEIARILETKRPKIILLENVKGLLNHEKGKTFSVIIQTLSELGYDVQWMVLNSKFFGVPQNRERVFIIGNLRGESQPEILPFRCYGQETIPELQVIKDSEYDTDRLYGTKGIARTIRANAGGKGAKTGLYMNTIQEAVGSRQGSSASFKKSVETIYNETMKIRRLTPIECERLQGFPDNWTEGFSDTQRYKMIGNAVTVNVVEAIAKRLKKCQEKR
ncbi:hypothetical protein LCGC14_1578110 [marine sediment metagenome]|uniref:DNA (cytosine-5-)-methyltransferase n=1 Tax=marine sediment metagenome TaxID=412755 RepID=A0A0F9KYL8_9ZZZZ